jgi:hypothetical protein
MTRASALREGYGVDVTDMKAYARVWVIAGFAMTALGGIVDLVQLVSRDYLSEGFRADIQLIAIPLGSLAALWAWLMLTKIATLVSDHDALFKSAFMALTLESLCLCATYFTILWSVPSFSEFSWQFWLEGLGSLVTAVGFYLMAIAFSNRIEHYVDAET